MKPLEYAPSGFDRASTREELFEVLEMLGGFDEPQETGVDQTGDLLACLDADQTAPPRNILEEICSGEERLLMEIEPFNSLLNRKAQRLN